MTLKFFFNSLKLADSFGVNINFRINKKEKFQSVFGGLVTVTYILFAIAYFIYNFEIFHSRQKMSLNYTEKIFDNAPFINFSERKTGFGIGIYFENNSQINMNTTGKYFDFDFSVVSVIDTHDKYKLPIKYGFCNETDFFNNIDSEFKWLNINKVYCPKDKELMFSMGTTIDELLQFVEITVKLREDAIMNDLQEVRELLTKYPLKVILYFTDTYLNVDEFYKPIKPYLNSLYLYIDVDYYKKVNLDFLTLDFSSDDNAFFTMRNTERHIVYENSREYGYAIPDRINSGSPDYENLVRFYLRSSLKSKMILRCYQKFSEYLSSTTVLVSNCYLIVFVIMRFINDFNAKDFVMKKILKFIDHENDKSSVDTIKKITVEKKLDILEKENISNRKFEFISWEPKYKQNGKTYINLDDIMIHNYKSTDLRIKIPIYSERCNTNDNLISSTNNQVMSINTIINRRNSMNKRKTLKNGNTSDEEMLEFMRLFFTSKKNVELVDDYDKTKLKKFIKSFGREHINDQDLIKFKVSDILVNLCCCKKSKKYVYKTYLYKEGEQKINHYLDILTFIKKMQELDLIKLLLLSPDQLRMLNFLAKPSISLIHRENFIYMNEFIDTRENLTTYDKKFSVFNVKILFSVYKKLHKKKNKSATDKKLLFLFENQMKQMMK